MIRKTLSFSLGLIVAGFTAVVASTPVLAQAPQENGTWQGHGRHAPNPQHQAKRLAKELNLSPDQETRLEAIFADRDQKITALRSDTTLSHDARREQMRGIKSTTRQQLSSVLTPDQMAQMEARRRGHHHGEPVQGASAAQQTPSAS